MVPESALAGPPLFSLGADARRDNRRHGADNGQQPEATGDSYYATNVHSLTVIVLGETKVYYGGLDYARKAMYDYQQRAFILLEGIPESTYKQSLINLVRFTTERNH